MTRAIQRSFASIEKIEREEEEERRYTTEAAPGLSDPPISSDDFINE